ncbi:MAG: hypothetical protein GDA53_05915 [Rhodobacteraceae bacterium]|nr:hypothetical protein [Paracoccaceae bacterium]
MNERTVGILSLVTSIAFGAISTYAVLKPDKLLRLWVDDKRVSYQDRISGILNVTKDDPCRRLNELKQFKDQIAFFRDTEGEPSTDLFADLAEHIQQAEADIAVREAEEEEAERQSFLAAEERARGEERVRREQEELAAQHAWLEQARLDYFRGSVCWDKNCLYRIPY